MDRGARQAMVHGVAGDKHDLATKPAPEMNENFFFFLLGLLLDLACIIDEKVGLATNTVYVSLIV